VANGLRRRDDRDANDPHLCCAVPRRCYRQRVSPPERVARTLEFLRRHLLLASLLVVDALTKVAAFTLLDHDGAVEVGGGLSLRLVLNEWGVMGGVQGIGAVAANPAYTFLLAAGLSLLAICVPLLSASGLAFGWRLLLGAIAFLIVSLFVEVLAKPLAGWNVGGEWVVPVLRASALLLAVALYVASRAGFPRLAFGLLAAGALGNTASRLYPPYEVVDFLMVPLAPFARLAGQEVGEDLHAILNVADLYVLAFPVVLAAWPSAVALRFMAGLLPSRAVAPRATRG